jgi:hypothetical protein
VAIPGVSDIMWWTMMTPLAFVMGITALREGYEDYVSGWRAGSR